MTDRSRRFSYRLRPAKQVERKLIVQCLHRLRDAGYKIGSYSYLGFGSIYYADFLLFHRYLYIDDMICVESGDFPKSMSFNRPYDFIRLELKPVAEVLPRLDRQRRHVIWLDYDYGLVQSVLLDIAGFTTALAAGSILIVTVKASPPEANVDGETDANRETRRRNVLRRIEGELGTLAPAMSLLDLTKPRLAHVLAGVLAEQFDREAARRRDGVRFHQLFSYRYSDGAQMLTIGGLLDTPQAAQIALDEAMRGWSFGQLDPSTEPMEIAGPTLTPREKDWLDQHVSNRLTAGGLDFDLDEDGLLAFQTYYREYPSYFETLL